MSLSLVELPWFSKSIEILTLATVRLGNHSSLIPKSKPRMVNSYLDSSIINLDHRYVALYVLCLD